MKRKRRKVTSQVIDLRYTTDWDTSDEQFVLADNDVVEVVYLPHQACSCPSVVVRNLPNLRELHVGSEVIWLRCNHLPALTTLSIDANVKWLTLDGLTSLTTVDLSRCTDLAFLALNGMPLLTKCEVGGCVRLKAVYSADLDAMLSSDIDHQIERNQSNSSDGLMLEAGMTADHVDKLLALINTASRVATERNLIDVEMWGARPARFGYRLLEPLEYVYTGGGGERYSYEFTETETKSESESDLDSSGVYMTHGRGEHSPEDCLKHALSLLGGRLSIPGINSLPELAVLTYLAELARSDPLL